MLYSGLNLREFIRVERMKQKLILTACCVGLLLLGLGGCSKASEEDGSAKTPPTADSSAKKPKASPTSKSKLLDQPTPTPTGKVEFAAGVTAIGEVKAEQDANLAFSVAGIVDRVLIEEGDVVTRNQTLAVLDTRPFDQRVRQAEAALKLAKAQFSALNEEPRAADVEASQAQIRQAQAGLAVAQSQQQALAEKPRAIDVEAAQAQVRQAQAGLAAAQAQQAALNEKPKTADVEIAVAQIDQAQAGLDKEKEPPKEVDVAAVAANLALAEANLQAAKDRLSFAKTQAELQVKQASYQLSQAQWSFALAEKYWQYVDDNGRDPVNPDLSNPSTGAKSKNKTSEGQEASYRVQYERAKAALQQAEEAVQQSLVNSESARKTEQTGVLAAEKQVDQAKAALQKLQLPPDEFTVAKAQAGLRAAQSGLKKLNPDPNASQKNQTAAGVAQAQAAVDLANTNLKRLDPDPKESQKIQAAAAVAQAQATLELANANLKKLNPAPNDSQKKQALANVEQAQAALDLALLNREYAEIRAPFDSTVSTVSVDPGDPASAGMAVLQVVDTNQLHTEVQISDVDIPKVGVRQRVQLFVDALPGKVFTGRVSYVAPTAAVKGNVRTFLIKIALDKQKGLRPGMSVRVEIDTKW